jgi:EpsI family protein
MTVRLLIAAAVVLGIYGGARWLRDRGMPTEPAPLEMTAQDLPTTLGKWKCEDIALDPEMFRAIGAKMVISRACRDDGGRVVWLHIAVFDQFGGVQGLIHPPEHCYSASGWTLGEPTLVSIDQAGATENVAKLLPVERRGEKSYILYWYQIDGTAYYTGDRQRTLLLASRGRPVRPPVVKVMLQTSVANPAEAEKCLKSFAAEVYQWSRGFH